MLVVAPGPVLLFVLVVGVLIVYFDKLLVLDLAIGLNWT